MSGHAVISVRVLPKAPQEILTLMLISLLQWRLDLLVETCLFPVWYHRDCGIYELKVVRPRLRYRADHGISGFFERGGDRRHGQIPNRPASRLTDLYQ